MAVPRQSPFVSLRVPAFRWWFLAQILSGSGGLAQAVGSAWLVLQLHGHGIDLGLLSAATFGPVLLAGPWAGALLDRFDNRRVLVGTQVCAGLVALALAILTASGAVRLWMVFALAVVGGLVMAVDQPARQLYVVELVGRERVQSAVGLYEVIVNASRVLGPASGGVMIAAFGVSACFFANAASFVPPLVVLLLFRPAVRAERTAQPHVAKAIREGLAYVRRSPAIVACLVIAGVSGMIFNLSVALPVLATHTFGLGSEGYGALVAAFGLGALPGGYAAARSGAEPSGVRIRALCLATAASVLATACAPWAAAAYALMALVGFTSIWLIALANTLVQLQPEPHFRGRVMGLWTMVLPGMNPVTGVVVGAVTQLAGPREGFGLSGAALVLAALGAWRVLGAHDRRATAAVEPPGVAAVR
jgi:MFS family permease